MVKFVNTALLATLSVARVLSTIINHDVAQRFSFAGMDSLAKVLDDTATFNSILDHGCWCSRLDPNANLAILGGTHTVDDLDKLCRDWMIVRACNDKYNGGSCAGLDVSDYSYQIQYDDDAVADQHTCNTVNANDPTDSYNQCESDSCTIDLYFVDQIDQYMTANPGFSSIVPDATTCPQRQFNFFTERYCEGTAPNLAIIEGALPTPPAVTDDTVREECRTQEFDLTIILDGSGSVSFSNYGLSVDYVQNFVNLLDISATNTRVGIIAYSSAINVLSVFDDNEADVNSAINLLRAGQTFGATFTNNALNAAFDNIRDHGRAGVQQVVMLVTDGVSTAGLITIDSKTGGVINIAEALAAEGVTTYAVGVGSGVSVAELQEIASDPDSTHMYDVTNFGSLEAIRLDIASSVCNTV